ADAVVFLFDAGGNIDEDFALLHSIAAEIAGKFTILAVNKCDLLSGDALAAYKERFSECLKAFDCAKSDAKPEENREVVFISVKQGGAADISDLIAAYLERNGAGSGGAILTGERHKALVDRAIAAIDRATASAKQGQPLDLIAYDVWECANALGEITGRNVTDEVIDTIFSKFCLGK
ncbi:MAG: hypothetical protein II184_01035, partial [Clostridia bacterium]|nr:hypothetical protein [Clostridia bacterium]